MISQIYQSTIIQVNWSKNKFDELQDEIHFIPNLNSGLYIIDIIDQLGSYSIKVILI